MSQPIVNQLFRPSKTRRLVSAWTVPGPGIEDALQRIEQFGDMFDHIIFMCGKPQLDGSLPTDWPIEQRRVIAERLRKLGISVLNDYGGGGQHDGSAAILRSPKLSDMWIKRLIQECDEVGADGVDMDFEDVPRDCRFAFTEFNKGLAEELHRGGKMLSICVGALSPEARRETTIGFADLATLAQHADFLRPMVYDLYCPPSEFVGPTSMAPWGRETMAYLSQYIPRHKIVMGLPTYSVDWDMIESSRSTQVYDYQWIAEREKESPIGRGWCYYWDVNLIRYTDEQGHPHLLYVSDARSTRSHLVTADSQDLAGVCFWVLTGEEDPAIWQCVREHFNRW